MLATPYVTFDAPVPQVDGAVFTTAAWKDATHRDKALFPNALKPGAYYVRAAATQTTTDGSFGLTEWSTPQKLTVAPNMFGEPLFFMSKPVSGKTAVSATMSFTMRTNTKSIPFRVVLGLNGSVIGRSTTALDHVPGKDTVASSKAPMRIPYRLIRPKGKNVMVVTVSMGGGAYGAAETYREVRRF